MTSFFSRRCKCLAALLSLGVMAGAVLAEPWPQIVIDLTPQQIEEGRAAFKGAVYLDATQSTESRIDDLVQRMTLDEKLGYLGGTGFKDSQVIGETQPLARLGVPKFKMTDATLGSKLTKGATLFPSYISLAASFDTELAYQYGRAVAEQTKADGYRILLGPGVNMYRVPNCGRNFEYLGEDPFLTSRLVVPYIQAVQDAGVIATVKHFAVNNSEYFRRSSNSVLDERTMREIYLPPFRAAVQEANVRAVMTSYNLINGEWAAENKWLVSDLLRKEWGFNGLVMTDWWSVYHTDKLIESGTDLEMPYAQVFAADRLKQMITTGTWSEEMLNERIRCILRPCFAMGLMDKPHAEPAMRARWDEHKEIAKQIGRESLVLLKNRAEFLPLNRATIRHIAVYGKNAVETIPSGGGAAGFNPGDEFMTYMQSIKQAAGDAVDVHYYPQVNAAQVKKADLAIVFLTMAEHEQMDRRFELEPDSLYQLQRVSQNNPNTLAVVSLGGGVEMASWVANVRGLIYAWYPGSYGAQALGEMLFGDMNPSGKLPISIEKKPSDAHYFGNYISENAVLPSTFQGWDSEHENFDIHYAEGVLTGYRWYDTKQIEPLFPFGYGLSYTSYDYRSISLSTADLQGDEVARITFTLKNTGERAGTEIVQLYIHDQEASVMRPVKELKGFQRISLQPSAERVVEFTLTKKDLSFWDMKTKSWKAEAGRFDVLVGASSRDLKLKATFTY